MNLAKKTIKVVFKASNKERNHCFFKVCFRERHAVAIIMVECRKDIFIRSIRNILNNFKRIVYKRCCNN